MDYFARGPKHIATGKFNAAVTRREFLSSGLAACTASLVAAESRNPAPANKRIRLRDTIPAFEFGKTGQRLPLLACGGSAMVERWSQIGYGLEPLPFDKRMAMVRHAYDA